MNHKTVQKEGMCRKIWKTIPETVGSHDKEYWDIKQVIRNRRVSLFCAELTLKILIKH